MALSDIKAAEYVVGGGPVFEKSKEQYLRRELDRISAVINQLNRNIAYLLEYVETL